MFLIPSTERPHCGTQYVASSGNEGEGQDRHGARYDTGGNQDPVELLRNRGGCSLVTTLLLLPDEAQGTR